MERNLREESLKAQDQALNYVEENYNKYLGQFIINMGEKNLDNLLLHKEDRKEEQISNVTNKETAVPYDANFLRDIV